MFYDEPARFYDEPLFKSSAYETASEAVLFCQECLEESGHRSVALQLKGLTPVIDANVGRIVTRVLQSALAIGLKGQAAEYTRIALRAVAYAIDGEQRQVA